MILIYVTDVGNKALDTFLPALWTMIIIMKGFAPYLLTRRVLYTAVLGTLAFPSYAQEQPVNTLSNIVVTASGFEQVIADAPATITVITKEDLQGKSYRNITDALQDVPGVSIEGGASGKFESTSITIRGLGENYVLFLVDGKPLGTSSEAYYNGFGGGATVNMLPPMSAIERIEVIRGPMSSLYGSSAMGGVINIITKKISPEWTGEVTLDATLQKRSESGDAFQGRYNLSGPIIANRLGIMLSGSSYHRREDRIASGYGKQRINNNNARIDWVLNDAHSLRFDGGITTTDNRRTPERSGNGSDMDMENKRVYYGVTHDWNWGERNNSRTYVLQEKVTIENGGTESEYRSSIVNTRTLLPLESHTITVGAEYKKEETLHDASRFPGSKNTDLSRWHASLFAEDEYNLTDNFTLTGGVRVDRNQHYGNHVTPRLYGVYNVSDDLVLKGGVSAGYKTPSLKQADDGIVENAARGRSWDMGNPDLQPEKSTSYELGFVWSTPDQYSFSVMGYHTRFRNKIGKQYVCQSAGSTPECTYNGETRQSIQQYINLDSARLQGLEVGFGMPIGESLRLSSNYTLSDSEITSGSSKGKPLNNTPRHMVNVGVDWQASESVNFWGKLKHKSRTIEGGSSRIPSYAMVDIGVNADITKNISAFAGIYNLLDKQISGDEGYDKILDGRRFYVGATVRF